jgi:predicted GIY-YIG superfamily endonuclease
MTTQARRSLARKQLKKWRRDWKVRLIEEQNPDWRDLHAALLK